jgi:riboflavin synthase
MFTGLVETQGMVKSLTAEGDGQRLVIVSNLFVSDIMLGESIAVNGVCLTVVEYSEDQAAFQLAPETLRRSNLGHLQTGITVNLERALRLGDRLGGHWVQGHVDGLARLISRQPDGDWEMFAFELPGDLSRYVVAKGSITLNGVSLTVVDVEFSQFRVALIPHTLAVTNLGVLQAGMQVNVEVDILAKYVEKLVGSQLQH